MEKNQLNSGSLKELQVGETLLTVARKVANGKIQLEFAEKVTAKDRPMSALTVLNASDARFSSGARRSWAIAEVGDAADIFDVNFGDDGEWFMGETASGKTAEFLKLDILNPEFNGLRFRVRVVESTEPSESQKKYADDMGVDVVKTQAKRAGKGGDYILHNGQHIFMNSFVDLLHESEDPQHVFLASDTSNSNITANTGVKADEVEVMI